MISSAFSPQLRGSCTVWNPHFTHFAAEHMNYALSKKNLLPQVLYAFAQVLSLLPRWIANGEMFDGIGLLTSLFRIQIFIFIVDPLSMKMLWTYYGFFKMKNEI